MIEICKMMKYDNGTPEKIKAALASEDYVLTKKIDGASYYLCKDEKGEAHLYKDSISKKDGKIIDKIDNVPHIEAMIKNDFPNNTVMVGEITYNYQWIGTSFEKQEKSKSSYVNSIMLALPEKAVQRQIKTEDCGVYIFDILEFDGEDLRDKDFEDRYNVYSNFCKQREIDYAKIYRENKQELLTKWLADGEEGGVLKLLRSKGRTKATYGWRPIDARAYRPANTTMKVKQVNTIDVIISAINMPEKEYEGDDPENYKYRDENDNPVNRLWYFGYANGFDIVDVNGSYIGRVASGLDDFLREDMAANPDNYIGRVVEISMMELNENGVPRHPVFKCFRDDKEVTDVYCLGSTK